uniref:Glycosyl transferase family 1 domain-containing protein n=1 Tax=Cyanothece sp. (strain PCC 7425 / ATCC 29141) TaxID=395961 RepID=B8HX13_CYAP4
MLHFFWCTYDLRDQSYNIYESSNFEIAKWAEYYLSQKTAFHQSYWRAGRVTDNPNDILLGHPTWAIPELPGFGKIQRNWVKDNALTASAACHPNTYMLNPWVPNFPPEWLTNMPFLESQMLAVNKIFALCGKLWIQKTLEKQDESIQSLVKDKLVHLNMGVAAQNIKTIKNKFNQIGERQIIHISNLGTYKGFDITCKSVMGLDTLLHVASRDLEAPVGLLEIKVDNQDVIFNFLSSVDNNDPEFNQWIVENCDFYIHTSTMDAQATTILENCARGLIPLITPESGFASPHAIYLTHNPDENRKIIEWALNLPEEELLKRSELIRQQIYNEHNWEGIFGKIWDEIMADIDSRSQTVVTVP